MINISKPYLPPLDQYNRYLAGIWERKWLTNNGPLVQELEDKLKKYLGVKHLLYVNNGTIALQIAIKALGTGGKIITTPFSYVATTNTILWEQCKPVFADINTNDFNIDVKKIEALITADTIAILATHVYGNPCDVDALKKIADKHGIKIIYDGAHAFGATYNGKQLLSYGDIATCSFHATKVFHTVEGGAIITNNDELAQKMTLYRQFGHVGDEHFSIGVNGKNSEIHAAMGLCLLPMMPRFIEKRKQLAALYSQLLANLPFQFPLPLPNTSYNYSYYPVVLDAEERLNAVIYSLKENGVNARRYFYPSLNNLPQFKGESCPVSESISKRVVALPLYYELEEAKVINICNVIKSCYL
jgi:dTDP-4-amino-4,6-dideoxygalactose transaminase